MGVSATFIKALWPIFKQNHFQVILPNQSLSDPITQTLGDGVPQGQCLSPHLYTLYTADMPAIVKRGDDYLQLAGHPLRGWPARLRGHKGSGLWKVWTVPSPPLPPLPSPPLPCPALPCPALPLPSPALPCPLPSPPFPPSLPPSLPRTLFRVRPSSNLAAL